MSTYIAVTSIEWLRAQNHINLQGYSNFLGWHAAAMLCDAYYAWWLEEQNWQIKELLGGDVEEIGFMSI